jgi:hypothetical protein
MKDIKSKFTDETYFNGIKYYLQDFKLNYRAVIPFYILLDPSLSANELRFYGIIEQMESSLIDVFLTDRAIAYILGINHESKIVQRMFRKLKDKNYLKREEREVTIGKRKSWLKCWNTVKGGIVLNDKNSVPDVHHEEDNYTAGVPDVHGGGVPDVHRGGVRQVHPCKALELKSQDINVCVANPTPTNPSTHTQLTLLTSNPECQEIFNFRFSGHDVSIDELADACIKYYVPTMVSVLTFKTWIRREKIENHPKKGKVKPICLQTFTDDELDEAGRYRQAKKDGFIETWYPKIEKREQARLIFEKVYSHMA